MGSRESKEGMPKWFVVVAIVVFLIGAGILALATFQGSVNRRYRAVIARMEADGIPTSFEVARGPAVPNDQCAATYLCEVGKIKKEIDGRLSSLKKSETYKQGCPTAEEIEKMRPVYADHPELWETIRKAADCPRYAWLIDFGFFVNAPESFPAGTTAFKPYEVEKGLKSSWVAMTGGLVPLWLAEGKRDEALESQILIFRLYHLCRNDSPILCCNFNPTVRLELAVAQIVRILEAGPASAKNLEALEKELAPVDFLEDFKKSEAFIQLRLLEMDLSRDFYLVKWIRPVGPFAKQRKMEMIEMIGAMSKQVAFDPKAAITVDVPNSSLAHNLHNSLNRYYDYYCRAERAARALRVLVALLRRDNPEEAPKADLSDLGLPKKATLDPFTGKPFQVSRDAGTEHWVIEADGWALGEVPKVK